MQKHSTSLLLLLLSKNRGLAHFGVNRYNICENWSYSNSSLSDEQGFPNKTRIAFSPISDRQNLLKTETKSNTKIGGFNCTGIFVYGVNNAELLNARYAMSWETACSFSPDVFFAPEMIATDEMAAIENCGSKYLKPLLKKVAVDGKRPPRLTIMPTYWRNRINKLLIFDETGKYVGEQLKRIAFIDEKNHLAEALITPPENTDILLIHLKNQQRMASYLERSIQDLSDQALIAVGKLMGCIETLEKIQYENEQNRAAFEQTRLLGTKHLDRIVQALENYGSLSQSQMCEILDLQASTLSEALKKVRMTMQKLYVVSRYRVLCKLAKHKLGAHFNF